MREPIVDWLKTARLVLTSRELDRLEEEQLAPQGKVKYQFSSQGHEMAQVLLAQALEHPHDAAAVYYRSRPFLLTCGLTVVESLAAGMARQNSPSQGRDVGVVYNLPRRSGPTILPASGDVGVQYTPAAGWAQAIPYRQRVLGESDWQGALAAALGGDGSVATNGFWSALTIATTLRLPLLFFIEDNRYGISVPSQLQTPGGDIAANLAAFQDLHILNGDGSSPVESWELISTAVSYVRSGIGPCLLRLQVPRLKGHTFIDDQAYKTSEERAAEAGRDPIEHLKRFTNAEGVLSVSDWEALRQDIRREIKQALKEAEALPSPNPSQATTHLFYSGEVPRQGGLRPEKALLPQGATRPNPDGPRVNFIDAVRRTLASEMERNPRLLVFGEDVGVKGGVHGATLNMQKQFSAERVFDTSLSEEGIIGRSVGLALAGLLPVPEIQFRKYADPAHEQINDLGTLRWRTANQFAAPVVVRIPVGYGKKTGDPWHSVTGEAIYAHTLGWRIAFPSNAEDAVGLLRSALRGDDPTFFFEHRALLDTAEGRRPYPGGDFCLPFGQAAVLSQGDTLTVVTWGEMVQRCLQAAQAFPGRISLIDLRTIVPWDKPIVLDSVRQTGKVLIVHEDTLTGGFGAEIAAVIAAEAFEDLDGPISRLATSDIPIPYNVSMMEAVIPSVSRIQAAMQALLEY
jgi:2-oxoisovalerate dehydrogenase E1 component